MGTISIQPMTTDMFYSYFKEYENDPDCLIVNNVDTKMNELAIKAA